MDRTICERQFRCLTLIDEYTLYGLAIHVSRSITLSQVKRVLAQLFAQRGHPLVSKNNNGPECIAKEIRAWLLKSDVVTHFIDL